MARILSDGVVHAARSRRLRWRALCGHALMLEGDPLPRTLREVDCMGCLGTPVEDADQADEIASGLRSAA